MHPLARVVLMAWCADALFPADSSRLAEAQRLVAAAASEEARLQAAVDLDGDPRVSVLESLLYLYGRQDAARRRIPAAFALLDSDGDRAITSSEVLSLLAREPQAGLDAVERRPRVMGGRRQAFGGTTGSSVGVGGGAYAFFGSQQAYIAGYKVVDGRYDPVIGVLGSGVVIEVAGVSVTIRRGDR